MIGLPYIHQLIVQQNQHQDSQDQIQNFLILQAQHPQGPHYLFI